MNRFLFLSLFPLLLTGCAGTQDSTYAELDRTLQNRMDYVMAYRMQCSGLAAKMMAAGSDSLRWYYADSLFMRSYDYSIDSLEKYSSIQLRMSGTTPEQKFLAGVNRSIYLFFDEREAEAYELFRSLDTTAIATHDARLRYLRIGATLYHKGSDPSMPEARSRELEEQFAERYIAANPGSLYAIKFRSQLLASKGNYTEALSTLMRYKSGEYSAEGNVQALIYYYIAHMYELMGNMGEAKKWYAASSVLDLKYPSRGYMSLYYLAQILYSENDLERADKYITATFEDMLTGGFNRKIINSAQSGFAISSALNRSEQMKRRSMSALAVALAVFILILLALLWTVRSQASKLEKAQGQIVTANHGLEEANIIMNSYVFHYMELSLKYLDRIEENRHELYRLYKSDLAAFEKAMRDSSAIYTQYKEFYATFDRIFLGIYPNFIDEVNSLLKESARFNINYGEPLPTEVRILAAIKLGISDSQKISEFLRCSISTVYNYRARLRASALCPKGEFENQIRKLC